MADDRHVRDRHPSAGNGLRFTEVQRFRQPLLLLVVAVVAVPFWYLAVRHFLFGWSPAERPGSNFRGGPGLAVAWVVGGVLVPALILGSSLTTEVTETGLRIRFWPFLTRRIDFGEIREAEAVTYRPLASFGGWGIRWGGPGKMAYNVSGRRGVRLDLTNGKIVVVGSQRADELADALAAELRR